jgi:mono/diheme cytochrome c family protein
MKLSTALTAAALSLGTPAFAETVKDVFPLEGDARRGALQFGLLCAGCHGATGLGDGVLATGAQPPPGAVRGPELAVARTDEALYQAIVEGQAPAMPAFGRVLSPLDAWDLVAYLRQGAPRVLEFFPAAGRELAKNYTLDSFALERLQKALGTAVPPELGTLQVVTVFNGDREPGHAPVVEPQDPVTLDTLKPKDKLGYLVFVPVQLPGDEQPLPVGLATDPKGKILKALSVTGTAADAARDRRLAADVGQGQKGGAHTPFKAPPPPKPAKPAKGQKAKPAPGAPGPLYTMDAAYQRAMEAVTMYDKEERDRTWADAPSK